MGGALHDLIGFWRLVADHLATGSALFIAVVADHTRHSPGSRGAKMGVKPDGSQFGTIGGGSMEADVLRRAVESFDDGSVGLDLETLQHKRETEGRYNPSGLICAGRQTMMYWVATPEEHDVYEAFATAVERDEEYELRVDDGAASVAIAPFDVDASPVTFDPGRPAYREHSVERHRVAIAGGGHCGYAVSRAMSQLGYRTSVYDVRDDLFTLQQNEWVDEKVVVDDYIGVGAAVRYPEATHFVVMTADLWSDVRALEGAASLPFPYVGVMGSSAKLDKIRSELLDRGVDAGDWPNFYAPIGLRMTSNTPDEIAISVAAQILREREKLFPWTRPSPLGE